MALAGGPPKLDAFESAAIRRADLVAIREICQVIENKEMTAAYPAHFGAKVRVTTADTETVVDMSDAWGDTENPMSPAAVTEKFKMLAAWAGVKSDPLRAAALDTQNGVYLLRGLLDMLPAPLNKEV